ncbi:glycosyltransferase family 2 protein, partial [bacterium]|nr:glycosyltransferase family 2 protein [bacterium]
MLISIIIPSYNYEKYIAQSIESVINQTYSDWELIIVDDGSTDNSIEIINSFCQNDDRIKLFTHENCENKGLVQTLKLGISKAKGDWVAILESDDIWTSDCLEHRVNAILQNKNAKLFFNTVSLIGEENRIKNMQKVVDKTQKYLNKYSY